VTERNTQAEKPQKGISGFTIAIAAILIASIGGMIAVVLAGRAEAPQTIPMDGGAETSASRPR
jgi:flagellar basal body-associated protein FliL